jgi:LAO/AO transport system kinase
MVDIFVVLMLAGAGDELQGIKKGVLELADLVAVNKADGDDVRRARLAALDYRRALHLITPASPNWTPPVLTCSAVDNTGLDEIWQQIAAHRDALAATGERAERRRQQQIGWMWSLIGDRLLEEFRGSAAVRDQLAQVEAAVLDGTLPAGAAADRLLEAFLAR